MTDSPEGLVDCFIVGSVNAQIIGDLVSRGERWDAGRMLRELWDTFGLQGAPPLLAVLYLCPGSWWPAIRLAWPDAAICANPGMPTLIRLHRPMQLAVDDSVAAASVWRNILMGLPAEISNVSGMLSVPRSEVFVKDMGKSFINVTR
ncbi:hypothetical protein D9758_010110 [Tetrapyrgos nigripes]|uniref:Uncharacterized protein n=1 Tax=Tetrapyrgos nigripes TaxID=182062 RepID=A0A8H5CTR4_9AGAR|nr:hypothetical protein D9758_010110 [Tetrapyrgos nigripes]